jgi:hypothetical protein
MLRSFTRPRSLSLGTVARSSSSTSSTTSVDSVIFGNGGEDVGKFDRFCTVRSDKRVCVKAYHRGRSLEEDGKIFSIIFAYCEKIKWLLISFRKEEDLDVMWRGYV